MANLMQKKTGLEFCFLLCLLVLSNCSFVNSTEGDHPSDQEWKQIRNKMVTEQIERRGVKNPLVLDAMRTVARHRFVPESYRRHSYEDRPLPIGSGQTISQPYIVAYMTEMLEIDENSRILEIGTGSGYQAAVLAEIAQEVYSIEIIPGLQKQAAKVHEDLGYKNIHLKVGDGYEGWEEEAPFDGIIVTAAPGDVPEPLKAQLKVGGRLVIPVGTYYQELLIMTRTEEGFHTQQTIPVRFVPMTGKAQEEDSQE
ncbi:protein-L-isoaspartate(D-aspartate) O-methyltransferase [Acidobacteriota bacterium]